MTTTIPRGDKCIVVRGKVICFAFDFERSFYYNNCTVGGAPIDQFIEQESHIPMAIVLNAVAWLESSPDNFLHVTHPLSLSTFVSTLHCAV